MLPHGTNAFSTRSAHHQMLSLHVPKHHHSCFPLTISALSYLTLLGTSDRCLEARVDDSFEKMRGRGAIRQPSHSDM